MSSTPSPSPEHRRPTPAPPAPTGPQGRYAARFEPTDLENLGSVEACLSLAAGAGAVWRVVRHPRWSSLPFAALGALLLQRGATRRCPVYAAVGVDRTERRSGPDATALVTIRETPERLYRAWRDLTNAPRFMSMVDRVEVQHDGVSRWYCSSPGGYSFEYDAEIIEDTPNEGIRWRSVAGAPIEMRGSVRFKPAAGKRGTIVIASVLFGPEEGGHLRGRLAAPLAGYAIEEDLMRFKQWMETGETATTDGQPSGRREYNPARDSTLRTPPPAGGPVPPGSTAPVAPGLD